MKGTDILGNDFDVECIGCALSDNTLVPVGGIIKETDNFILLQDIEVPIKGFLVIASKQHIKSFIELPKPQAVEFFKLCYDARAALGNFEDINDCTFIQEERSGHFHFWILPKYKWMNDLFDDSISSIRPIMKYAEKNLKSEENIEDIQKCVERLKLLLNE
ncbi:MAG: HIT family hydrolase [Defluviitaleaceae bacterium]|nr:HIT family hydrolase [Defluviitaleaceae bacterium]MCL2836650.1 HIT family hydrolase [Defluviitaleaceae bacterium]